MSLEGQFVPTGPYKEGVDAPPELASQIFFNLSCNTAEILQNSALVTGADITQRDNGKLKEAHRMAAKTNPWVYNQSTQETNLLVAQYARKFGKYFNTSLDWHLSIDLLEALAHCHDLGRWFTHRRRLNDLAGNAIMALADFNPNFTKHLPSDEHWMPVNSVGSRPRAVEEIDDRATSKKYADISEYVRNPYKKIVEIADILGKWHKGRILKWEEVEEVSLRSRLVEPDRDAVGVKEYIRLMSSVRNMDGVVQFYQNLGAHIESQIKMPISQVVGEMEEDLAWKPLPKTYHQENARLRYQNIVWDFGGVFGLGGATQDDGPLLNTVVRAFGVETEPKRKKALLQVFAHELREHSVGRTGAEVDRNLATLFGKPVVQGFTTDKLMYDDAATYRIEPNTVRAFKFMANEGVNQVIASNTEESGWREITRKLIESGVRHQLLRNGTVEEIRADYRRIKARGFTPVFASFIVQARKTGDGGYTVRGDQIHFYDLIRRVTEIDPSETLVVDDRKAYMGEAVKLGYQTAHCPTNADVWAAIDGAFV